MLQTFLVTLWAGICGIDDSTTQMLRRPLPIATVTGLIMGDLPMGLVIGATLEIMYMGIGNVGAYAAPDLVTGSVIATALSINSGGGVATAVTLAVPTSLLAQQLLVLFRMANVYLNPWAKKIAAEGALNKTILLYIPSFIMIFLCRALPTFIAVQFGSNAVEKAVEMLPEKIMTGLSSAGGIIPAVGIALLMVMMIKDSKFWVFLIAGFVMAAYLELSILPIALFSLVFALLYDIASQNKNEELGEEVVKIETKEIDLNNIEEGSFDL